MHIVVRGAFSLVDGDDEVSLAVGDVVLVRCPASNDSANGAVLRCVNLPRCADQPAPAMLTARYASLPFEETARIHVSALHAVREPGVAAVVDLLRAELEKAPLHADVTRALLDSLLAYVERAAADQGRRTHASDPRVARARQQMLAKLSHPWTVSALAKAAGLSRAAFARRFTEELGAPPLRYLAERRMELAARLLADGQASLAAVAADVGYESEFSFSRAFKRWAGVAPGVYRRRAGAERHRAAA